MLNASCLPPRAIALFCSFAVPATCRFALVTLCLCTIDSAAGTGDMCLCYPVCVVVCELRAASPWQLECTGRPWSRRSYKAARLFGAAPLVLEASSTVEGSGKPTLSYVHPPTRI